MRVLYTKITPKMGLPEPLSPIQPAQVDEAAALWCAGWHVGHENIVPKALVQFRNEGQFRARILNSLSDCLVVCAEGKVVAFVRLKGAELDQFYVAPDRIGAGFAAHLMAAAEQELRNRGQRDVFLIAAAGNDRAIRFYEKMGWRNKGARVEGVETEVGPFQMGVVRFEKTL